MACTLGFMTKQTRCVAAAVVSLAWLHVAPADATTATCAGRTDVLGTSRVLAVGPATPPLGRKFFPQTLPLADKEVVLTFDDGPLPATTGLVLAALANECVKATFFMVGQMAEASPDMARRVRADGHTVAYHTYKHPLLSQMRPDAALREIEHGFEAVDRAVYGSAAGAPRTPFFRFPGFAGTPALLADLAARHITVFGADLWASDWNPMTPAQELALVMARLDYSRGGILLLHDTKRQTAAMLPALLRRLKAEGFKIVHIVPMRAVAQR